MPLTFTDNRVVSAQELSRMAAAVAGTYVVPTSSGGAVSASSLMTVAVAAITANTGLFVNGTLDTTGYAGGTTVIATADVTNPRRDYVWTDGAGAIGNTTGTAAANPVLPDLTAGRIALAEIYVSANLTTVAAGNIIDRRGNSAGLGRGAGLSATAGQPLVYDTTAAALKVWDGSASQSLAGPVTLAGSSSAATSTTSTSAVDLVVVTVSIPVATGFQLSFNARKQALAANGVAFGWKANATVIGTAGLTSNGVLLASSANNRAEDGMAVVQVTPRSASTYLNGVISWRVMRVSATGADATAPAFGPGSTTLAAPMPNATLTSITVTAINDTASNAAEVFSVRVLTGVV